MQADLYRDAEERNRVVAHEGRRTVTTERGHGVDEVFEHARLHVRRFIVCPPIQGSVATRSMTRRYGQKDSRKSVSVFRFDGPTCWTDAGEDAVQFARMSPKGNRGEDETRRGASKQQVDEPVARSFHRPAP